MKKVLMPIAAMGMAAFVSISTMGQSFDEVRAAKSAPILFTGGLIVDGKLGAGENFTVTHPATGTYIIRFKKNLINGSPMLTCTPYGTQTVAPICTVKSISISSKGVIEAEFLLYSSKDGTLADGDFMFTEITV